MQKLNDGYFCIYEETYLVQLILGIVDMYDEISRYV